MDFLRRRARPPTEVAPETPYDGWMRVGRVTALALALLLAAVSLVPPALDGGAGSGGADVNVTTEFYTVLDGGGGYITWDFSPAVSARLRAAIDTDADGAVAEPEFQAYQQSVDSRLERGVLVLRNFEIAAVRLVEQRGFVGEAVDAPLPAHLRFILNGQFAARDIDVALVGGGVVTAAFPDVSPSDEVHERTVIVAAGFSSFVSLDGQARAPRVPAGAVLVHSTDYRWGDLVAAPPGPDVRFERFSAANSTVLLLFPLCIAFYLGVRRPRLEQEGSGRPRVAPFHDLLGAGFLFLVVAYFAGVPGIAVWVGGCAFGALGLWAAFQFYPVGAAPAAVHAAHPPTEQPAGSQAALSAAMQLMEKAHQPVGKREAEDVWAPVEGADVGSPAAAGPRPAALGHPLSAGPFGRLTPAAAGAAAAPAAMPSRQPARAIAGSAQVRCPGCRHLFGAAGARPLTITCPRCGRKGVLR